MNNPANKYLLGRGITQHVINIANLHANEAGAIVIPVYDVNGDFLFNKYRRNPEVKTGPKYTYDKGATAALYNAQFIKKSSQAQIFICEGELDAARLLSEGFLAVSTTGGAGTFRDDWIEMFENKIVYIIYDADEAGVKGAFTLKKRIPNARILWLPKGHDVTDYLNSHGETAFREQILVRPNLFNYRLPEDTSTKVELKNYCRDVLNHQRELKNEGMPYYFTQYMIDYALGLLKNREKSHKKKDTDMKFGEVKDIPITYFLDFRNNKRSCPWHEDKTASLHYYEDDNHCYCFGKCQRRYDVIDVVQHEMKLSFVQAVNYLKERFISS